MYCECEQADHPHHHCDTHGLYGDESCPGCEEHVLKILSLHDAEAECSCGHWHYALTGKGESEKIRREHLAHIQNETKTNATIYFHPQVWVGDSPLEVDPLGDITWRDYAPPGMSDDTHESDQLHVSPRAPQWVKDWAGPFWIEIIRDKPDQENSNPSMNVTRREEI